MNIKKVWKGLPSITRWLLVTFIAMLIMSGAAYAYVALTGTGQVTVVENLSWVGENTFAVNLYPQESVTKSLTIANASSSAMIADIVSTVTPDPGSKGMSIDMPKTVTVPANGQVPFNITITVGKSAEPITYTITFEIQR